MMTIKRSLVLLLCAVMLLSLCACAQSKESSDAESTADTTANESEKLPDFTVYNMNGEEVSLYESFGKPLVVNFWATWCPPCKAEMPAFDEMYARYGESVDFMMVNMTDGQRDTVDIVKSFIEGNGYSFPVYCDSDMDAAYSYGVQSIPTTLFFSAEGELLEYKVGAISEVQLEEMLRKMMEGTK
ncbi:MAG: TlpA family protein disulfide reductase [Ruminococcaceae bacterium]|nr:TlpA family protein disulfide reductase [Oscillospiraceae bacterium]